MEIICTTLNYKSTIARLRMAKVDFQEVTLHKADGPHKAIKLNESVSIRLVAGTFISQN